MEENNTPETPEAEKQAAQEPPKEPNRSVSIETTLNGETKTEAERFHTPTILEAVKKLDDSAKVKIVAPGDGGRILFEGTKEEAVQALTASIVPPEQIAMHVQKLVQFLADHSNMRAISVEAVFVDNEGHDAGVGFVSTVANCTAAQAMALVNCCDANVDEFIAKAKLSIPGRTQPKGGIVTPTEEQVKALG